MSEDQKPTWIKMFEKEISDLRSDINQLAKLLQKMLERENAIRKEVGNLIERYYDVVRLLEAHKDSEATLMALQIMKGLDIDKELEEVTKYAREKGKSAREAFEEMATKGILPKGLRNFAETKKKIREML
jgi:regulator of replication initiation timing